MAETSATIKDAGTQALIPVDGVAVTVTPNVLVAGQSIRQGMTIGDGGGVPGQFAGVDSNNRLAVYTKDYVLTGITVNLAALNNITGPYNVSGLGRVVVSASFASGGVFQVQGSIDGILWIALQGCALNSYPGRNTAFGYNQLSGSFAYVSGSGVNTVIVDCAGMQQIRLRCSTSTTSTPNTASLAFSSMPVQTNSVAMMIGNNGFAPDCLTSGTGVSTTNASLAVQLSPLGNSAKITDGTNTASIVASTGVGITDVGLVVIDSPNSSPPTASTSALTNVTASIASVTLIAANVGRRSLYIVNDSTAILYLTLGAGASTTTSYSLQLAPGTTFTPDIVTWRGAITGIWSAANGAARITELTY